MRQACHACIPFSGHCLWSAAALTANLTVDYSLVRHWTHILFVNQFLRRRLALEGIRDVQPDQLPQPESGGG